MNDNEALQKCFTFLFEASKVIINSDTPYEFTCPLCGGKAVGVKASINGHIHASCDGCGIKIMQ